MSEIQRTPRRAWVIWAVGLLAYVVAVFQRSSLAVAGLQAQERFHAGAAVLSLFAVVQLAVYAGMQVPVGVLLDRLGSRRMLLIGALVMALGQLALGLAHSTPTAIAARVLVGAGDAMTFISVLRVVSLWFSSRHVPLVTQLTGILGQLGQIAAAYPLVALLHSAGWTSSYLGAAGVSVLAAILVGLALVDAPAGTVLEPAVSLAEVRRGLREAWHEPGTRIGLWTHFTTQYSGNAFALLWGYPFLVAGEGLSPATAGVLLTVMVVVGMAVALVLGQLVGRWPLRRSAPVLTIVGGTAAAWGLVLAWPGAAPLWALVVLVCVLGTNGPGSMIGFDYARTYNPATRLGRATGIVNVGGFVAALTTILVIGVVLDVLSSGGAGSYGLGAFKVAFAVQYALWALGLAGLLRTRRRMRRALADDGVLLDPLPQAVVRRLRAAGRLPARDPGGARG